MQYFVFQKYEEAETEFKKVLALDPDCKEAKFYARECQIHQIQRVGCYRFVALKALQMTGGVLVSICVYIQINLV